MNEQNLWAKLQSEYYAEWAEMFGYELATAASIPPAWPAAQTSSNRPFNRREGNKSVNKREGLPVRHETTPNDSLHEQVDSPYSDS